MNLNLVRVKPSRSIRWCLIADDGRSSSTWSLFRAKKSDHVYLVAKGTEGLMKVSFHQTGEVNIGLTSEAIQGLGMPNASRFLLKGHRIPQLISGWTPVSEIWIPRSELRSPKDEISPKTVQIPFHPMANAVVVQIYFKESTKSPMLRMPPHEPVGFIEKLDGGSVWVVAMPANLPWDPERQFEQEIREAKEFFDNRKENERTLDRDHLWGIDEPTKTIIFFEKAFDFVN